MEEWRDFLGYKVSNLGNIKGKNGTIMKPCVRHGYDTVYIYNQGGRKIEFVHTLVSRCFLGEKPLSLFVRHIDGDKKNNRADNLKYGTQEENEHDKFLHGTALIGEKHFNCKISDEQFYEIKRRYKPRCRKNGANIIAREMGVHPMTVLKIARGRCAERNQVLKELGE